VTLISVGGFGAGRGYAGEGVGSIPVLGYVPLSRIGVQSGVYQGAFERPADANWLQDDSGVLAGGIRDSALFGLT
jgi:hypothetical protein